MSTDPNEHGNDEHGHQGHGHGHGGDNADATADEGSKPGDDPDKTPGPPGDDDIIIRPGGR